MTFSPAPKFVEGSTMRHVVVMTATGSVGLISIFIVDFLNLFYISRLGQQELAAAVGYAGTVLFFTTSVCIGLTIASSALVSRALGARERADARRLAGSSVVFALAINAALAALTLPFLGPLLSLLGATGRTHDIAWRFLMIVVPWTPALGLGMTCSGLLRATGDARRSMYVTLAGGIFTAIFDPIFIFLLGLGVDGAAIVSVLSRCVLALVGLHGCIRVHDLIARPTRAAALADARALSAIAVPAVLANVATPIGNAFVTAGIARHGDSAVAGYAVIGRVLPVAFGAIFALSSSVGPILGQNLGARRYDRLQGAIRDSLIFILIYCTAMWGALALLREPIVQVFGVTGEGAALIRFFCVYIAGTFMFVGILFVANSAFNNLGFATWSTVVNWGRATLGTIPFVLIGARYSAEGVLAGQALGGVLFGIAAIAVCFRLVGRMSGPPAAPAEARLSAPPLPPLASERGATALDLGEPDNAAGTTPDR